MLCFLTSKGAADKKLDHSKWQSKMYTEEQKLHAVQLVKKLKNFNKAWMMLGYPESKAALVSWVRNYDEEDAKITRLPRYTDEQIDKAIDYYLSCQSIQKTIDDLGYPDSRMTLWRWIKSQNIDIDRKRGRQSALSDDEKIAILLEYLRSDKTLLKFSLEKGIAQSTLRAWMSKYKFLKEDDPVPKDEAKSFDETPDNDSLPPEEEIERLKREIAELKAQKAVTDAEIKVTKAEKKKADSDLREALKRLEDAQLEYDILEKAAELLKKVDGININSLKNKEKAIVINALREKHKLAKLLKSLKMAKSSYEYQVKALRRDKYENIRKEIRKIFDDNYQAYGYRRIHGELKNQGRAVSEKVVRRIMKEENVHPFVPRMKKYSSYQGEISPEVPDLYKHDFKAEEPYKKTVTDITEFSLRDGKVYLSHIIDLYDGCPINWKIGYHPDKGLTNSMLKELHDVIPKDAKPIIHSDRGCHYRIQDWIDMMEEYGYTRSMSRKGCSPDNAACEGFFGILKREFFHNHDWSNVTRECFIKELDKYLTWFKIKRIKERLGYLSPTEYRSRTNL